MNSDNKILLMVLLVSALITGCGSEDEKPNEEEVQLGKLADTWVVTSVEKDDMPVEGYESFELTLTGTAGSAVFAYGVVGRPLTSPWPASGNWAFGSNVISQIIRDPATADELNISYAVTATTLEMDFIFSGAGYEAGKVYSAEGHWVFSFIKK